MPLHGANTGQQLLGSFTDTSDAVRAANETLDIMTKKKNGPADGRRPRVQADVPVTREHPVFTPGHAGVQQPQGAAPQRGRPNAHCRQGAKKRKAPTEAKPAPRPKPKSWTTEEAAALYPKLP